MGRAPRGRRGAFGLAAGIVAVVLVAVVGGGALVHVYSDTVRNLTREDSIGYLEDISGQITENVRIVTSQIFSALETVERGQRSRVEAGATLAELNAEMAEERARWNLDKLAYVDEDGMWCFADGTQRYVRSQDYLNKTLLEGESSVSGIESMDGRDVLVFSIPVDFEIEGHRMKALVGVYGVEDILHLLSIDSFDGQGFAYIVRSDGSVAVRSAEQTAVSSEYNIVSALETQNPAEQEAAERLRADLASGAQGVVLVDYNGVPTYVCYTPVGVSDWRLLSFVPSSYIDERSNSLYLLTVAVGVTVALVFGAVMLLVVVAQHRNRRRLEHIAYVDPVTGGDTLERFRERFQDAARGDMLHRALVYANIAKFKSYNDREGKEGGDRLLAAVSRMIGERMREGEFTGRVAADHFVTLLNPTDESEVKKRLDEFSIAAAQGSEGARVSMDFGVYLLDEEALKQELTLLIDAANLARTSAEKQVLSGGSRVGFYDARLRRRFLREKELEDRFPAALAGGEFHVFLQPKVALPGRCVDGAEALVRWFGPEGKLFPDEFIPLFERNGMIAQLDFYMFRQVCALLKRWESEGRPLVSISVNISRANFDVPDFFDRYEEHVRENRVPARWLEFEFTESVVFDRIDEINRVIRRIHALGARCSMDDFGSSYSSLNMLRNLEVDIIKLDRGFFVGDASDAGKAESIVGGIVGIARAMRIATVAEGVEELDQVSFLEGIGCDMVQGYVFGRPMPAEQFQEFRIDEGKRGADDSDD
ncbi:bifunctional diguanylate cyclase/phosphodiesterase [Arabiibacter massiliensis]|uniref:bifunctional diguanylate cyclase/phosphodiesterase n=1 Tax=Arabiibacter massiliensis TaxID=1870985 RepID=UPI0009BB1898|nr:EAL domain-containing protein [Arabiibacter massiliensis]